MYSKLNNEDLKVRLTAIADAKPVAPKRQSLKSEETTAAEDPKDEKMKSIFEKAGLNWEEWQAKKQ